MAKTRSIADAFDYRNNSLNFLRLVFATAVIVAHSTPIGGFSLEFQIGSFGLGTIAVAGFFAISGFLITRSRMRMPLLPYTVKRLSRILPGFWVCLAVTAFVLAPLVGAIAGGWNPDDALAYVITNADMSGGTHAIGTTLAAVPMVDWWNGSLWTLRYEVMCYIAVGILLTVGFVRRHRVVILAAFIISTVTNVATLSLDRHPFINDVLFLGTVFLAGAVLYLYSEVIPLMWPLALAAAVLFVGISLAGFGRSLAGLPIAYLCFWLGANLPAVFRRINAKNDISYGMYLYGAPVQQVLVILGLNSFGHAAYIVFSVLATIPFAVASWFLIENPSMKLSSLGLRKLRPKVERQPELAAPPIA